MKTHFYIHLVALIVFIAFTGELSGRNAPVTTAGSSLVCPGSVVAVPLTVDNFSEVSSISLRLDFNPQLISYTSFSGLNPALAGAIVNRIIVNSNLHKIIISWSNMSPLSLENGSKLLDLNFVYISENPSIVFNNTANGGGDCEFSDESSDPMNDTPTAEFYHDATFSSNLAGNAGAITGQASVCQGQAGISYSVAPISNATDYIWTMPTGATIVTGTNTNVITVNYNSSSVSGDITVHGVSSCGSGVSSLLSITVIPVQNPVITGQTEVCLPSSILTYTTQSGQVDYQWAISAGGTILSGNSTNTITVIWNSAGNETIAVNYSNSAGCAALSQSSLAVTVAGLPNPTISGPANITLGSGEVQYITQAGMNGYNWDISAGGTITAGTGTNAISVLWETTGNMTVSVNYLNQAGCTAANACVFPVTVSYCNAPLTVAGSSTICPGGAIEVPVNVFNFNDVAAISLRLDYNPALMSFTGPANMNPALEGCEVNELVVSSALHKVMISWSNITPVTLADNSLLLNLHFTHLTGSPVLLFNNLTYGGGECEYANGIGTPMNDMPTANYYIDSQISNIGVGNAGTVFYAGVAPVCQGQSGYIYQTASIPNATTYIWSLPSGGTIISGENTNSIVVAWSETATSGNITVKGSNNCGDGAVSQPFPIVVHHLPGMAAAISGPVQVIQNQTNVAYSVPAIENVTGYVWTLPMGVTIASGINTNSITVNFTGNAKTGNLIVSGINECGLGIADTLRVKVGFLITGCFRYNNNIESPLDSLHILLLKNEIPIDSTFTNLSGYYLFEGVQPGVYTISATSFKPWGGVNASDAIKIQRHYVGLEFLNKPVRLLAADVNFSNSINTTDAIKVKRRFSGIDSTFVRPDWTFAKNGWAGDTITVIYSDIVRNYYGLCTGDVNGSHNPSPSDSPDQGIVLLSEGMIDVAPGQVFDLPINVRQAMSIGAVSLSIPFPVNLFEVLDVRINQSTALYSISNGLLKIAWSELNPLQLYAGGTLVSLKLKAKETFTANEGIDLQLNSESELADNTGEIIYQPELATLSIRALKLGVDEINQIISAFKIYPNPVKNQMYIELYLNENSCVSYQLFDITGKEVYNSGISNNSIGDNLMEIPINQYIKGIYLLKISIQSNQGFNEIIQKMMIEN